MRGRTRRVRWVIISRSLGGLGLAVLVLAALLHWQVPKALIENSTETWHWVERASWVAGVGALFVAILTAWQARSSGRETRTRPVDPPLVREAEANDRLRAFLGRRDVLPRMGDPSTRALALRVHPAIPLASPGANSGAVGTTALASAFLRLRALTQTAGHQGKRGRLDPDLPLFVERDKYGQLLTWFRAAAQTGGFLVVVGNVAVGKTRLLYELARKLLPDFHVLAPDLGDGDLVNKIAQATFPLPRLIVWLDELDRFLDGPQRTSGSTPITATTLRHLLESPTPVIVLGSLWPEHARQLRSKEVDAVTNQPRALYPGAVDVLDDGRHLQISLDTFSPSERQAAAQLAPVDPRLAEALADHDFNVTEVLAGAPQLIRRYEQSTPDQKAILWAAIDARRLGIQAPLSERLLCAAARGYLSVAHPYDTWFQPALTDLVRSERATTPLLEMYDPERRRVIGYTVADFLLQRATQWRRAERVPAFSWQSLIDHTSDLSDLGHLARSAEVRLRYSIAIPIYRRLADSGDPVAARRLARLLAEHGQVEELRARADAGDHQAYRRLAEVKAEHGQLEDLRGLANNGDALATIRLAELVAEPDQIKELDELAKAGDPRLSRRVAELLAEQLEPDQLQMMTDASDMIVELLGEQDDVDNIKVLRTRADSGHVMAARRLASLLAEQGQVDELRARADAGDESAAYRLAELQADQGQLGDLRALADAGNDSAAGRLVELLVKHGRVDELWRELEAGNPNAGPRLADLFIAQGRADEGSRMKQFGLTPGGSIATQLDSKN